ncbi:AraC family transcriptional regulator [Calothrix sp. PCC 7716]|nr:AraC family transcriptional regulator [Calothrix sp. PCC 7716]
MAQEQAKFWRDSALSNLEMLSATYITHSFGRHTHDGFTIGVIEAGVEAFTYQGSYYVAPASSIVIIHPGEVHTGHAGIPDGWKYRVLYPDVKLLQTAFTEVRENGQTIPFFPQPVIQDASLATQLRQFHIACETSASQLEKESRLLWTLAQLVTRYAESRPLCKPVGCEHNRVQCVKQYLDDNYAETISLEQLAKIVNLKSLRLLRAFLREVGLPPHAYLVQLRVNRAKAMLAMGIPISQVAAETGFTDQSHLHRHFKRLVGVTPGQYVSGCCNNNHNHIRVKKLCLPTG